MTTSERQPNENVSDLSYDDTLWKAADALRGQVDAAEYKYVVLWNGSFPWVSAKDMHGRIIFDSELRLTDSGRNSIRRIAPRHATLMVIRGMSLMTEVRIGWCTREVAFNQDLRAFIARDDVPPRVHPLVADIKRTAVDADGRYRVARNGPHSNRSTRQYDDCASE